MKAKHFSEGCPLQEHGGFCVQEHPLQDSFALIYLHYRFITFKLWDHG